MPGAASNKEIAMLVIDDDDAFRSGFVLLLKGLGYQKVMSANSALSGLQKIQAGIVDVVFCDWNMPVMSGVECLKEIRGIEEYRNLPFIFITAHSEREKVVEAIKLKTDDYIIKNN